MIARILTFIFYILVPTLGASGGDDIVIGDRIDIEPVKFQDSKLELQVSFHFSESKAVYSWRGNIYPILDKELHVEVRTSNGDTLSATPISKPLPESIKHYVTAKYYQYPHALKLLIKDGNEGEYNGCFEIKLEYDTISSRNKYLSKVDIDSNILRICKEFERIEKYQ